MKRLLAHEKGIGTLINEFDALSIQTVETFNEVFHNCKLVGFDPKLNVTIGEYNKGRRTVTIGDSIILEHEFSLIDLTWGIDRARPFNLKYPSGEIIGKFNFYIEAYNFLDICQSKFKRDLANSKLILEELKYE